jgi:hypothetical protein
MASYHSQLILNLRTLQAVGRNPWSGDSPSPKALLQISRLI